MLSARQSLTWEKVTPEQPAVGEKVDVWDPAKGTAYDMRRVTSDTFEGSSKPFTGAVYFRRVPTWMEMMEAGR